MSRSSARTLTNDRSGARAWDVLAAEVTPVGSRPDREFLAECTCEQLRRIESLTTTVRVVSGRTLWRPGRSDRQFLIIVDGEATVSVDGRGVATLGPGCGFGTIAIFTPQGRRAATVTAATPMTLLVLHRGELHALLEDIPVVARRVQRATARRLIQTTTRTTAEGT